MRRGQVVEVRKVAGERHDLRFFEKDLRVKITSILLSFVLVSLLASVLMSHALITSILHDSIERSALDSARLTGNIVEVGLDRRSTLVELLATFPLLRDPASKPGDRVLVLNLFIQGYPLGEGAVFVDTNGNVITGTGRLAGMGNVSETVWFQNAQTAMTSFTFIYQPAALASLSFSKPVLAVSTPVRDAAGQIFAYLVVFTTPSDITDSVEAVRVEDNGHGFLVSPSGTVVAGHLFVEGPTRVSAGDSLMVDRLVKRMSKEKSGSATVEYSGREYLVTYATVGNAGARHPELDWIVGVAVPAGEAYSPANKVALALFGMGAVILVVASIAAFFLGRSISRPLDELVRNAEKVGSGDLTGEVVIRTRDQIGSLAAAFLRMRDYLRSALAEASYTSNRMSLLAEEQSAATQDMFANIDEIAESVVVLAKNMESQTEKIRKLIDNARAISEQAPPSPAQNEVLDLAQEAKILAEVGASKAVEIASAAQDQRAASRDLAAAARTLSEMARELKEMAQRFKT